MVDELEHDKYFALTKQEHKYFREIYNLGGYYSDIKNMPDSFIILAYPLTQIAEEIYVLKDKRQIEYPVKRLYYTYAQNYIPNSMILRLSIRVQARIMKFLLSRRVVQTLLFNLTLTGVYFLSLEERLYQKYYTSPFEIKKEQ